MKDKPTYIYRLYHKHTGLLVYIGASIRPKERFKQHKSSTFKGVPLKQVVGEVFDNRETALSFEKKAIKKERPMDNIRGGHKYHMFRNMDIKKSPTIAVRTTANLKKRIEDVAVKMEVSSAAICRIAIVAFLKKEEAKG